MQDLSVAIHPEMLHGGPRPVVEQVFSIAAGDDFNVTRWTISAHAGTHVEAPRHTVDGAATIVDLPLETFVGTARVLDLTAVTTAITPEDLVAAGLAEESRVLLKTTNASTVLREHDKAPHWVGLTPEAAQLLVERGAALVGTDYLTIETPANEATFDAHYVLQGAGVALLEAVDLSSVDPGLVDLVCAPIMLDAEAAPARVVLGPPRERGELLDISIPVRERMVTWGRAPTRIDVETMAGGDHCNVTRWIIGTHTGAHLDAPLHYTDGQASIEAVPLETSVGPVQVLDLASCSRDITASDLLQAGFEDATRVLLRTRNSIDGVLHGEARTETWIGITEDAAALLVERGVVLVGVDTLSIEGPSESVSGGWSAHHVLCDAGLTILECLDLIDVNPGDYELFAAPIPLVGAEAAPVRAFLSRIVS
jgi:arylformamidase